MTFLSSVSPSTELLNPSVVLDTSQTAGVYFEVQLLGHMVILHLTSWGIVYLVSTVPACFTFPPAKNKGSDSSTFSPIIVIASLFDYYHPSEYEAVFHYGLFIYLF